MILDRSPGRRLFQAVNYLILILTSLLCILPFVNLLAVSFSGSAAVSAGKSPFGRLISIQRHMRLRSKAGSFFKPCGYLSSASY